LADITDDEVTDRYLDDFGAAQRRKRVFLLDLALQTAELSLLTPVIERRHEHNDNNGSEDSNAFYPACLRFALIMGT